MGVMNTPISLTSDLLDTDVAFIATKSGKFVSLFDPKSNEGKVISLPDFGTLLIGFESAEDIEQEPLMPFLAGETDILWIAPKEWRMGNVAKRFGMFPSISQALKNGFGAEIENGFSQVQLRCNKMRGVLTIFKKVD